MLSPKPALQYGCLSFPFWYHSTSGLFCTLVYVSMAGAGSFLLNNCRKSRGRIDLAQRVHSLSDRKVFGSIPSVLRERWPKSEVQHTATHRSWVPLAAAVQTVRVGHMKIRSLPVLLVKNVWPVLPDTSGVSMGLLLQARQEAGVAASQALADPRSSTSASSRSAPGSWNCHLPY